MDNKRYIKEYEVRYYELDNFGKISLMTILNYLEDIAISHSDYSGYGFERLKSDGVAWILNRWVINIDEYPDVKDTITVETWASGFERFYATREFLIKSSNGKIIGRATTLWLYVNILKKRPCRIPAYFADAYGLDAVRAIEHDFNIKPETIEENYESSEYPVYRKDIDTNNHVNNKKYVEWMLESTTEPVYDRYIPVSLEIEYLKEGSLKDNVVVNYKISKEEKSNIECGYTIFEKNNRTVLSRGKILWKLTR